MFVQASGRNSVAESIEESEFLQQQQEHSMPRTQQPKLPIQQKQRPAPLHPVQAISSASLSQSSPAPAPTASPPARHSRVHAQPAVPGPSTASMESEAADRDSPAETIYTARVAAAAAHLESMLAQIRRARAAAAKAASGAGDARALRAADEQERLCRMRHGLQIAKIKEERARMVVEERQQQVEMEQQRMRLRSLGLDTQSPRPSATVPAAAAAPVSLAAAPLRSAAAFNAHASISTNLDASQAPPPSTVGTEYSAHFDGEQSARDSDDEAYSDTFVSESVGSEVLDALDRAAAAGGAAAAAPVSLVAADEAAVLSSIRLLLKRIDQFSLSASVEARAGAADAREALAEALREEKNREVTRRLLEKDAAARAFKADREWKAALEMDVSAEVEQQWRERHRESSESAPLTGRAMQRDSTDSASLIHANRSSIDGALVPGVSPNRSLGSGGGGEGVLYESLDGSARLRAAVQASSTPTRPTAVPLALQSPSPAASPLGVSSAHLSFSAHVSETIAEDSMPASVSSASRGSPRTPASRSSDSSGSGTPRQRDIVVLPSQFSPARQQHQPQAHRSPGVSSQDAVFAKSPTRQAAAAAELERGEGSISEEIDAVATSYSDTFDVEDSKERSSITAVPVAVPSPVIYNMPPRSPVAAVYTLPPKSPATPSSASRSLSYSADFTSELPPSPAPQPEATLRRPPPISTDTSISEDMSVASSMELSGEGGLDAGQRASDFALTPVARKLMEAALLNPLPHAQQQQQQQRESPVHASEQPALSSSPYQAATSSFDSETSGAASPSSAHLSQSLSPKPSPNTSRGFIPVNFAGSAAAFPSPSRASEAAPLAAPESASGNLLRMGELVSPPPGSDVEDNISEEIEASFESDSSSSSSSRNKVLPSGLQVLGSPGSPGSAAASPAAAALRTPALASAPTARSPIAAPSPSLTQAELLSPTTPASVETSIRTSSSSPLASPSVASPLLSADLGHRQHAVATVPAESGSGSSDSDSGGSGGSASAKQRLLSFSASASAPGAAGSSAAGNSPTSPAPTQAFAFVKVATSASTSSPTAAASLESSAASPISISVSTAASPASSIFTSPAKDSLESSLAASPSPLPQTFPSSAARMGLESPVSTPPPEMSHSRQASTHAAVSAAALEPTATSITSAADELLNDVIGESVRFFSPLCPVHMRGFMPALLPHLVPFPSDCRVYGF